MKMLWDALAGLAAGALTGLGVGGGGLLMLYMTTKALGGLDQHMAQGVNLWYYLPAAGASLVTHIRERNVDWKVVLPAVAGGLVTSALGAWLSHLVDAELLRRLFGGLLLYIGVRELFAKK